MKKRLKFEEEEIRVEVSEVSHVLTPSNNDNESKNLELIDGTVAMSAPTLDVSPCLGSSNLFEMDQVDNAMGELEFSNMIMDGGFEDREGSAIRWLEELEKELSLHGATERNDEDDKTTDEEVEQIRWEDPLLTNYFELEELDFLPWY